MFQEKIDVPYSLVSKWHSHLLSNAYWWQVGFILSIISLIVTFERWKRCKRSTHAQNTLTWSVTIIYGWGFYVSTFIFPTACEHSLSRASFLPFHWHDYNLIKHNLLNLLPFRRRPSINWKICYLRFLLLISAPFPSIFFHSKTNFIFCRLWFEL